jgi:hypothetical protein
VATGLFPPFMVTVLCPPFVSEIAILLLPPDALTVSPPIVPVTTMSLLSMTMTALPVTLD